jgi:hypothetical protein
MGHGAPFGLPPTPAYGEGCEGDEDRFVATSSIPLRHVSSCRFERAFASCTDVLRFEGACSRGPAARFACFRLCRRRAERSSLFVHIGVISAPLSLSPRSRTFLPSSTSDTLCVPCGIAGMSKRLRGGSDAGLSLVYVQYRNPSSSFSVAKILCIATSGLGKNVGLPVSTYSGFPLGYSRRFRKTRTNLLYDTFPGTRNRLRRSTSAPALSPAAGSNTTGTQISSASAARWLRRSFNMAAHSATRWSKLYSSLYAEIEGILPTSRISS